MHHEMDFELSFCHSWHFAFSNRWESLVSKQGGGWTKRTDFEIAYLFIFSKIRHFLSECLQIPEAYFLEFKRFIKMKLTVFSRASKDFRWNTALFALNRRSILSETVNCSDPKHLTDWTEILNCFWNKRFFAFLVCGFCKNDK